MTTELLATDERSSRVGAVLVPLALAALLGIFWFAAFNPITRYTPGIDSGVYLYIGQQMLKGAVPYRDVFDNKGPLLYVINAVGLAAGRGSFWGVYVLEYALLASATIIVWRLLKTRVGMTVAAALGVFFVLEVAHVALGNHEEEYAVVLQAVALLLLARRPTLESRRWAWLLVGVLGAGALFLKPTTVGLWIALVVALALLCVASGGWRQWGGRLLVAVGGAAAVGAAVLVSLAATGALGAFRQDYFGFNATYVGQHGLADRFASLGFGAGSIGYLAAALAILAWVLTLRRVIRSHRQGQSGDVLALIAIIWLPIEVALSATSGYSWRQYYFMWLLPITMLLGFAALELRLLASQGRSSRRLPLGAVAVTLLLLLALASVLSPSAASLHDLGGSVLHHDQYASTPSQAERLADFIRTRTKTSDYVLVWGSHYADLNLLAGRRSPTRYVMQMALYGVGGGWAAQGVPQFLADLKAHPPALILDSSPTKYSGSAPPISATANPWASSPPAVSGAWASVYAYLKEHYRRAGELDFAPWWPVYVRRD